MPQLAHSFGLNEDTIPSSVVGYVRVSDETQLENNSIEEQAKAIAAEAERLGYDLSTIYFDPGVTGTSLKERPGLRQAMQRVMKDPDVAGVVFFDFKRLSRATALGAMIMRCIREAGKRLFSISDAGLDMNTKEGRLHAHMMMMLAEYDRDGIVELLHDRRMAKGAKGGWIGGRPPYGKRPLQGELVDDLCEQRVVRLIRRLRKWVRITEYPRKARQVDLYRMTPCEPRPMTYQQIADYLNAKYDEELAALRGNSQLMRSLEDRTEVDQQRILMSMCEWAPKTAKLRKRNRRRPYKRQPTYRWTNCTIGCILASQGIRMFEGVGRPRKGTGHTKRREVAV